GDAVGRLKGLEYLGELVVKTVNGQVVRLNDVARLELMVERRTYASLGAKPIVALALSPTADAGPGDVMKAVRAELGRIGPGRPKGLAVEVAIDFTPNLESPRASTTPGFVLIDVTLPGSVSIERTVSVLEHVASSLRETAGVQEVLAMTEHPF